MNKKEVSMFLTGVTGRRLCMDMFKFHRWAEERICRPFFSYDFGLGDLCITDSVKEEITDSITYEEWQEIAGFFIQTNESEIIEK